MNSATYEILFCKKYSRLVVAVTSRRGVLPDGVKNSLTSNPSSTNGLILLNQELVAGLFEGLLEGPKSLSILAVGRLDGLVVSNFSVGHLLLVGHGHTLQHFPVPVNTLPESLFPSRAESTLST